MCLASVPEDAVKPHGGMTEVQHLELVILVATVENQLSAMLPTLPFGIHILRTRCCHCIIPSAVLQYDGLQLSGRIGHSHLTIVYRHRHLLMTVININICVSRHRHGNLHLWVHQHKAGSEDRMAVIIIGKDRQLVVAAHRQPAMLVGNGKTVVRIEMIGVERLFVVVDGEFAIESL